MNKKQLRHYVSMYHPYVDNNPKWIDWYVSVAPLKAKRTRLLIQRYKDYKSRVLDCGSGIGLSLYYLSQYYPHAQGIDTDKKNVAIAKKQFKMLNCKAKMSYYDGNKLPFPNDYFDMVLSMEVWEHAVNTDHMLKEIARVLKPNGILHVTTANKLWPIEPHYKLFFLSYLPYTLADLYLKLAHRAGYYHEIHLPTYGEFKKSVEKYFFVTDVTLDTIINYKEYGLDKERGKKIAIAGLILKQMQLLEEIPFFSLIPYLGFGILRRISLGWLFIASPKKKIKHRVDDKHRI